MGGHGETLRLEMHFARDLTTTSTLDNLQVWLSAEARSLCATLEVHGYERDPDRLLVDLADPRGLGSAVHRRGLARGALFLQLVAEHPPPEGQRRFGSVLVRGRGRGTAGCYLGIQFDSNTPLRRSGDQWLWSNSIDVSVTAGRVEGLDRSDWVRRLGLFLAQDPDLVWGAAYVQDEFRASNLDASSGLRAIGRDARRHLPGLYWLNYFGEPYTSLMALDSARATGIGTGRNSTMQSYSSATAIRRNGRPRNVRRSRSSTRWARTYSSTAATP
jgi:hypothetical protein